MTGATGHAFPASAALDPDTPAPVRLPPVWVRTEPCEVAQFGRATGGMPEASSVPLTFPFRWLALPAVRGLIVQALGGGFLPIHEAQSFTYQRKLQAGADYLLSLEARRSTNPDRLTLEATVLTAQQEICAHLETVLRIVPLAAMDTSQ